MNDHDDGDALHSLTITTRRPACWLAVDLASGDVWRAHPDASHDPGLRRADWRRATDSQVARLAMLLGRDADAAVAVDALAALLDEPMNPDVRLHAWQVVTTARGRRQ